MENSQSADQLAFERMLFFSDAVFAIAITLLVIEIKVPVLPHGATDRELGFALVGLIPRFVGFIISFFLVGQTWVEHHRIGRQLQRYERGLLWSNLWMLFFVAAMPFAMVGFTLIPLVARLLDRRGATPPKRLRVRPTHT